MSNQDSGGRVPMSRLSQLQAEKKSDESGYKTKKATDESPPVISGRGRMLTALSAVIIFFIFSCICHQKLAEISQSF